MQRKVTQRKHAPEPPKTPVLAMDGRMPRERPLLAEAGAHATGPSWPRGRVRASMREPRCRAAHPGFGCDARRQLRGPEGETNTHGESDRHAAFAVPFDGLVLALAFPPRRSSPSTAARPGAVARRCSSPSRVVQRPACSARARPREEHREPPAGRRATGCAFDAHGRTNVRPAQGCAFGRTFCVLLFAQAKKSNTPAGARPASSRSRIAAGDTTRHRISAA